MLLALRFEPTRFFLKGKVRQEKTSYIHKHIAKPTDKHQYLHSTRCHPRHCKTSIAYSQAVRLRRIYSNDSDFLCHSQVLKKHLVSRGDSSRAIHQANKKVKSMPRLSVLSEKPTTRDCANKKIPLVTYPPSLPPIRQITSANHHIIHTSDRLQRAIPEEPMIAFRCPPSLRDLLARAEVPPTINSSVPPIQHGMFRCTYRCVTCQEHVLESDFFKSHSTGAHHKIRGHITCTTSNIMYLISCRIYGIQYIGETKKSLRKWFYGQRSTVKTHKLDTSCGPTLNLPNHSISDMILQGIEALANRRESVRLSREKMWIRRVHTIHPHGLNVQERND